jgi:uncharacterized protein (DUF433 family)
MARYPLNLPSQLKRDAETWAAREGVSLNQFVLWAVAEKVAALRHELDDPDFPHVTYVRGGVGQPVPVLRGGGVSVQAIAVAGRVWGMPPADIAAEYGLTEAQVRDGLGFFDRHRPEIEAALRAEESLEPQARG